MKRLVLMLQFATRLPLPYMEDVQERDLQRGVKYLPLVGIVVGLILWAVYRIIFVFDTFVAAVTAVLAEAVITGGLHQDGLADTFDGLYSNKNSQEMLAVMRDSRLGTNGVVAVTGVLLLKVALIHAVSRPETLLIMPVFSRLAMVYGISFSTSARKSGLGYAFIEGVGRADALLASLITIVVSFYFINLMDAIALMALMLAISMVFIEVCRLKIGGMTGDTLGALEEISCLIFLTAYGLLAHF